MSLSKRELELEHETYMQEVRCEFENEAKNEAKCERLKQKKTKAVEQHKTSHFLFAILLIFGLLIYSPFAVLVLLIWAFTTINNNIKKNGAS